MKKTLATLAITATACSNLYATEETTQTQIDELKQQIAVLADTVDAQQQNSSSNAVNLGGYGELHLNLNQGKDNQIDFHRYVLFVSKEFNDRTRFFSELELEHSLAGEGKPGEVELEQAYVEYDLTDKTAMKAGLFLIPVGILNETHEPDTFYGVERNSVEKNIIPTTWWEGGVALTGKLQDGLSYDLAVHSGLNAFADDGNGNEALSSIRSGREKVAKAAANKAAYTARIKYTAVPGLELAATIQLQDDILQGAGESEVNATLYEAHAIYQKSGFELRALYAMWLLDDRADDLASGSSEQSGFYLEPSYRFNDNVGVFFRTSAWDNAATDSTDSEYTQNDIGVNYWLAPTAVLKADYFRKDKAGELNASGYNLGVGFSF